MPDSPAITKQPLAGVERAFRAATIFLSEGGEFRLSVALFGHSVRRAHWIDQMVAELGKQNVQLTECRIPETGQPRLLDELSAHLHDVPTLPGQTRAVVVTGISHHLPDAASVHDPRSPTPPFLAAANLDRELFPKRCPHPLLLCVTPTAYGLLRRHAPDLMHWCSHTFDFTEPALPDGTHPIRGITELEHARPGTIYANRDELLRAAGIFRAGLDAAIAAHGPEHRETIGVRANLANVLSQLERRKEALALAQENLRLVEKTPGVPATEIAPRISQLADLLDEMGRQAEAEPLMRQVLAINEASFDKDHPVIAVSLNNLAQLLQDTNRFTEAEPLMRRALAIEEASFGKDAPETARDLNNLAELLRATGRLAEAEPLMQNSLTISEKSLGKDHPKTALRLNNLAQLLKDTNRLAEAEPLMRRALAIDEASYGENHLSVGRGLNNLAQLLKAMNRLAEAEPMMRRALEIFVNFGHINANPHPYLNAVVASYRLLLIAMGHTPTQAQEKIDQILGPLRAG